MGNYLSQETTYRKMASISQSQGEMSDRVGGGEGSPQAAVPEVMQRASPEEAQGR